MTTLQELETARTQAEQTPLLFQGEIAVNINWFADGGVRSPYDKKDVELALFKEGLSIWNTQTYNAQNILNILTPDNSRKGDVEVVLKRLLNFKQNGYSAFGDSYRNYNRGVDVFNRFKEQVTNLTNENTNLSVKINQLEKEKEELKDKNTVDLTRKLVGEGETLNKKDDTITDLQTQNTNLKAEITQLKQENKGLNDTINQRDATVVDLTGKLVKKEDTLEGREDTIADLRKETHGLETDKTNLATELKTKKGEVTALQGEKNTLQTKVNDLGVQLQDKDKTIVEQKNTVADLNDKNNKLVSEKKELENINNTQKTTISDQAHTIKDQKKIIDDNKGLDDKIKDLTKQLSDKDVELKKRNDDLQSKERERQRLEDEKKKVEQDLDAEKAKVKELEKRPDIPVTKEQWEKDWSQRPTKVALDSAVQAEKDKFKGFIDPKDSNALENAAKEQGKVIVSKGDYDGVVKERDEWKKKYDDSEKDKEAFKRYIQTKLGEKDKEIKELKEKLQKVADNLGTNSTDPNLVQKVGDLVKEKGSLNDQVKQKDAEINQLKDRIKQLETQNPTPTIPTPEKPSVLPENPTISKPSGGKDTGALQKEKQAKEDELQKMLNSLKTKLGPDYPEKGVNELLQAKSKLVQTGRSESDTQSDEYREWKNKADDLIGGGYLTKTEVEKLSQLQAEITKLEIKLNEKVAQIEVK